MTRGKKIGGPKIKTKFQKKSEFRHGLRGGVGKRLQCHKNSYLKDLVFYCLETAFFGQKISISYPPSSVYVISILLHRYG